MHWNVNAVSWLGAAGIALLIGGFQQAGWKHRTLIYGLLGAGALCLVTAAGWPLVEVLAPWLAGFLASAATPTTWVVLGLLIVAYVLIGPQFRAIETRPVTRPNLRTAHLQGLPRGPCDDKLEDLDDRASRLEGRVTALSAWTMFDPNVGPPIGTPELRQQLEAQIRAVAAKTDEAMGGLAALTTMFSDIKTELETTRLDHARLSTQVAIDHQDMISVLEFGAKQTTAVLLAALLADAPALPLSSDDITEISESEITQYLENAKATLADSERSERLRSLLEGAVESAEFTLERYADADWPKGVSPVVVGKRLILWLQLSQTVEYVKTEKRRAEGRVGEMRAHLVTRYGHLR